jgi:hypothetical protein
MNQIDQAKETISKVVELEQQLSTIQEFQELKLRAYVCVVVAQIEMANKK